MSLNSLSNSLNQIPFFPPGIASHKTSSFYKRPQNVKECKKLSKTKSHKTPQNLSANKRLSISTPNIKVWVSSTDVIYPIPKHQCDMGLSDHSIFKATPLPEYYSPDSLKRNRTLFEQLEHNHKTHALDQYSAKSRSLDRISMKSKSKNITKFVPEKPFYPPSKYPNIHDKANVNLNRLLDTRQQYKTPRSRKSLSILNRKKSQNDPPNEMLVKKPKMNGSLPNLNLKNLESMSNSKDMPVSQKDNSEDYTPEIGLYRHSDKLDLQDEVDSCVPKQMSESYYYPKPIPNPLYNDYYDRMAQSLYNESSLAAKIQTGSLERATRSNYSIDDRNRIEVTDLDDSPSKSYSPLKQCNSFSQDSLDGNKVNPKTHNNIKSEESETTTSLADGEKSYNSNSEDISLTSESKTYKFQSLSDDNFPLMKTENQNKYLNSLSTISEREKTYEDMNKNHLSTEDSLNQNPNANENSLVYPDKQLCYNSHDEDEEKSNRENVNDPRVIDSNFQSQMNHDLISNNDKLQDQSSGLYNNQLENEMKSEDQEQQTSLEEYNFQNEANLNDPIKLQSNNIAETRRSYHKDLDHLSSALNPNIENFSSETKNYFSNGNRFMDSFDLIKKEERGFEDKSEYVLKDQYNLDRYLIPNDTVNPTDFNNIVIVPNSIYVNNEFFEKPNVPNSEDQKILDEIASKCIVSTDQQLMNGRKWKKEECICEDNLIIGESCIKCSLPNQDHRKNHEIDSAASTVYSSINTQVSGLDYDLTEMGITNHLFNDRRFKTLEIPQIIFHSDVTRSVEDSSPETESSLSGSDDTYFMRHNYNSVYLPQPGLSWVSSPELTIARSDIVSRRHRRYLQSDNPLKPLCNVCFKPAYFMERISINNIIFHKLCFLCTKCNTHLSFNNCIIHRRRPYCLVHAKLKRWKIVRSASANKLNQIKERLDTKSNLQKQSNTDPKQQKRVFYGGIKSAKEKFLQDTTTNPEPVVRQQKRFTPPRQGVTAGVIESEPKPRDPNIFTAADNANSFNEDLTRLSQSSGTKEKLARFREIQQRSFETKNVANGDDSGYAKPDLIPVDTKTLRNKFLSGLNDSNPEARSKKINPSEEIQELTKKESNTVFENEPEVRDDVVKSNQKYQEENMFSKNKAKEMKDLFSNYTPDDRSKRTEKFQMEIGEGGVYESNPQERKDDVIPHKYERKVDLPNDSVKTGLQKIKDLQSLKCQGYQKSNNEPIKLDIDPRYSGIYENTPAESQADMISDQNDNYLANIRDKKCANEAKKAFLEKQILEEGKMNKNTPQMIDIWKDLCVDSGVFENKPVPHNRNVTRYDDKQNEELTVHEGDVRDGAETTEHDLGGKI